MRKRALARPLVLVLLCACLPLIAQAQGRPDIQWMRGGHLSSSQGVVYSADGQTVTSIAEGFVKVFRTSDGMLLRTIFVTNQPHGYGGLALSPDGQTLAVGMSDSSGSYIKLFRLSDGELVRTITTLGRFMRYVAFSPNGQLIAGGGDNGANGGVWRVSDGGLVHDFAQRDPAVHGTDSRNAGAGTVVFSPDGQYLATGGADGNHQVSYLYRVSDWYAEKRLPAISPMSFSPNGQFLAFGTYVLEVNCTGTCQPVFSGPDASSAAFSPDGQTFGAGVYDDTTAHIKLWNVSGWSEIQSYEVAGGRLIGGFPYLAFSPDSQTVAAASLFEVSLRGVTDLTGAGMRKLTLPTGYAIGALAFSPDGQTLATASGNTIYLLDSDDGSRLNVNFPNADGGAITHILYADNGQKLVTLDLINSDKTVKGWDAAAGTPLWSRPIGTGCAYGSKIAVSPDGQTVAFGGGCYNGLTLLRVSDGTIITTYAGDGENVPLAFSADGQTIAVNHFQSFVHAGVRLRRVSDASVVRDFDDGEITTNGQFSPDGRLFVGGTFVNNGESAAVKVWRVSDGAMLRSMPGHTDRIYSVALTPDGQTIASSSWDNTVRLWRASDGTPLATYDQESYVFSLEPSTITFSPDGSRFAYGRADATVVMANNPVPLDYKISAVDATVTEGDEGTADALVTVELSGKSAQAITVNYATSDGTAGSPDYTGVSGTLNFAAGERVKTISIPVKGDALDESDETFLVNLSSPANASLDDGQAAVTITDDDAAPSLSVSSPAVTEGNAAVTATFAISLSAPSAQTITVKFQTANGTATAPADYAARALSTLTFAPGQTSKAVSVSVVGDTRDEPAETFNLVLSSPTNATIAAGIGTCTITDNDPTPSITITNATVTEPNSGAVSAVFTVKLSAASGQTVTVKFVTANGTAVAPADYAARALTTLTFSPGETTKNVSVSVAGDLLDEANETFKLVLSSPTNATVSVGTGTCTITDNDPTPSITITNATVTEPDGGTTNAVFMIRLSAASGQNVTVKFQTADGTALAPGDYAARALTTLTFSPGQTTKAVSVSVKGDLIKEANETFFVNLSAPVNATIADAQGLGTITNDD